MKNILTVTVIVASILFGMFQLLSILGTVETNVRIIASMQ